MTRSRTTRQFRRLFSSLPLGVQQEAKQAYRRLFQSNPAHRLAIQETGRQDYIYSARIGLGYRALAAMKEDCVLWYWIGSHSEYDRMV